MLIRAGKIFLCALVAMGVGMAVFVAVEVGGSPGKWSRSVWLWDVAIGGALFYLTVPSMLLVLLAMFRQIPSTALSILVAIAWLSIIFAWWAYKPWVHYGEFPWLGFRQHFIDVLPVPLSFGLTFALCVRSLLVRNVAFKKSPLKAEQASI